MIPNREYILFDFYTTDATQQWSVVNDGVMGGLSTSKIVLNSDQTATFSGTVSLLNNGGFTSIRTQVQIEQQTGFKGVSLRVKGDGLKYSVRFSTQQSFDSYVYQQKIQTVNNKWIEVKLPFSKFEPTYRGRTLSNKPTLVAFDIVQAGFLIADKQAGTFKLSIDWVKLYN